MHWGVGGAQMSFDNTSSSAMMHMEIEKVLFESRSDSESEMDLMQEDGIGFI